MKQEYIWDKTGSDEGVEALENALRVFSHDKDAAFAIPVVEAPQKWSFFKGLRPLIFAAASIAIVAIAWGAWMQLAPVAPIDQALVPAPSIEKQGAVIVDLFEGPPLAPAVAPDTPIIKAAYRPRPKNRSERIVLRTIPAENRKPEFTKEEIYAYDQLVLALSITSDKLGQVREKAVGDNNNTEEK